jgi:Rod binding domain-containing protein
MNGTPAVHTLGLASVEASQSKLRKAAQDFESVLLGTLLEQMEQAVQDESSDSGTGNMTSLGTEQIARAWAQRGGIGMGKVILPYLQEQANSPDASTQLKLAARLPMIIGGGLNEAIAE